MQMRIRSFNKDNVLITDGYSAKCAPLSEYLSEIYQKRESLLPEITDG